MYPIVNKSRTISTLPFVTGQTQIKFDVPAELKQTGGQRVIVKAIQVFSTTTLAALNGLTPFTAANLINLTLNLVLTSGKTVIVDLPLIATQRSSNGGYYYATRDLQVDWEKSFVKVQLSTGLTASAILPLEVVYESNSVV